MGYAWDALKHSCIISSISFHNWAIRNKYQDLKTDFGLTLMLASDEDKWVMYLLGVVMVQNF